MFQVIRTLVTLGLLFAYSTTASPSGLIDRRDANTCPYPYQSRSLDSRQNGGGLSFTGSQWIWTNERDAATNNSPAGTRAFRKTFGPPEGKTPSTLKVAFAIDNDATLFVNGQEIAHEGDWFTAGTYCVPLKPCMNVIALNVTNFAPSPAGLLVTAEVTYTDGSTSKIISDGSWRASGASIPGGWEQLSFDDSSWELAVNEGAYPKAPWGNIPIAGSDAVSLENARWIWTDEATANTPANVPAGARALRRTVILPPGHTSASAEFLIAGDNQYSVYVNGRFVGSGNGFHAAKRFTVDNIQGPNVVIAIYGVNNLPSPAAILFSMQITSTNPSYSCLPDCSSVTYVISDAQWKANRGVPNGFEQSNFDDSAWSAAVIEGTIDSSPWAPVSSPTEVSGPGAPLSGAPAGN